MACTPTYTSQPRAPTVYELPDMRPLSVEAGDLLGKDINIEDITIEDITTTIAKRAGPDEKCFSQKIIASSTVSSEMYGSCCWHFIRQLN